MAASVIALDYVLANHLSHIPAPCTRHAVLPAAAATVPPPPRRRPPFPRIIARPAGALHAPGLLHLARTASWVPARSAPRRPSKLGTSVASSPVNYLNTGTVEIPPLVPHACPHASSHPHGWRGARGEHPHLRRVRTCMLELCANLGKGMLCRPSSHLHAGAPCETGKRNAVPFLITFLSPCPPPGFRPLAELLRTNRHPPLAGL